MLSRYLGAVASFNTLSGCFTNAHCLIDDPHILRGTGIASSVINFRPMGLCHSLREKIR